MKTSSQMAIRSHHAKFFKEIKNSWLCIWQPKLSPLKVERLVSNTISVPLLIFHITRSSANQKLCWVVKLHWRSSPMMNIMMFEINQVLSFRSVTCSPSEESGHKLIGQASAKPCSSWATPWTEAALYALCFIHLCAPQCLSLPLNLSAYIRRRFKFIQ